MSLSEIFYLAQSNGNLLSDIFFILWARRNCIVITALTNTDLLFSWSLFGGWDFDNYIDKYWSLF